MRIQLICLLAVGIFNGLTINAQNKIGIGTNTPTEKLEVNGNIKADTIKLNGLLLPANAANGKVLTSDALGNASWQSVPNSGSGWSMFGNNATSINSNFIGTTDAVGLRFKIYNIQSGELSDTSLFNTSFGFRSLLSNSSGTYNLAFGSNALRNNTFGAYNTAMGAFALHQNAAGEKNIAIGANALYKNQSHHNIAIGYASLRNDSTGSRNIGLGTNTLFFGQNPQRNIAIGFTAGQYINGSDNVVMGDNAGQALSAGSKNIVLGTNAEVLEKNMAGAIGYGAYSNQDSVIAIGNSAHRVAIAKMTASETLDVAGNIKSDSLSGVGTRLVFADPTGKLFDSSVTFTTGAGSLDAAYDFGGKGQGRTIVADSGAVTISGGDGFEVRADTVLYAPMNDVTNFQGNRMYYNPYRGAFRAGGAMFNRWNADSTGYYSAAFGENNLAYGYRSFAQGYNNECRQWFAVAFGEANKITGAYSFASGHLNQLDGYANFGAGTGLLVKGDYSVSFNSANKTAANYSSTFGFNNINNSNHGFTIGTFNDSVVSLANASTNAAPLFTIGNGIDANNRSNAMIVRRDGKVGIGINNPNEMLEVNGNVRFRKNAIVDSNIFVDINNTNSGSLAGTLRFGHSATGEAIGSKRTVGGNQWGLDFYTNGINRMMITWAGNTGIGLAPTEKLHVNGNIKSEFAVAAVTDLYVDYNASNNDTKNNSLRFGGIASGEFILSKRTAGGNQFGLDFYAGNARRVSILNNGNVGINTATPSSSLDVNGLTETNQLQVGGGDVVTKIQKGTVSVGSHFYDLKAVTITFPTPFASLPQCFFTPYSNGGNLNTDGFAVTIRTLTTTSVTVNVERIDMGKNGNGWGQSLNLQWMAIQ